MAWLPPPSTAEYNWNVNECLRVQAGKPMAPFITHTHATGGALTTRAEFVAILSAIRRGRIDQLTLWANIDSAQAGTDFVAQLPVIGNAISAVWQRTPARARGRFRSRGRMV